MMGQAEYEVTKLISDELLKHCFWCLRELEVKKDTMIPFKLPACKRCYECLSEELE